MRADNKKEKAGLWHEESRYPELIMGYLVLMLTQLGFDIPAQAALRHSRAGDSLSFPHGRFFVIPAQAGIQDFSRNLVVSRLDPRLRGDDDVPVWQKFRYSREFLPARE